MCYSTSAPKINYKQIPYFDNFLLPKPIKLIYASSDKSNDSLANKMIEHCDKFANQVLTPLTIQTLNNENIWQSNTTLSIYCEKYFFLNPCNCGGVFNCAEGIVAEGEKES